MASAVGIVSNGLLFFFHCSLLFPPSAVSFTVKRIFSTVLWPHNKYIYPQVTKAISRGPMNVSSHARCGSLVRLPLIKLVMEILTPSPRKSCQLWAPECLRMTPVYVSPRIPDETDLDSLSVSVRWCPSAPRHKFPGPRLVCCQPRTTLGHNMMGACHALVVLLELSSTVFS